MTALVPFRHILSRSRRLLSAVSSPPLVSTDRKALVRTDFTGSPSHVPLALNDVYVIDEQLPYAYFFREHLCDKRLQQSLQRVLSSFPVLGGRLCLDTLSIVMDETDTVPLTVGRTCCTDAQEWLAMHHANGELLPLFDPLPKDPWNSSSPLATIRVTHMDNNNGTVIGVNISHAAADGASCIDFMYCWGREHRRLSYPIPSHERAQVTTNGMLTLQHKDLMNLDRSSENNKPSALGAFSSQVLGFSSSILSAVSSDREIHETKPVLHEFVLLRFSTQLLSAMKEYGQARCAELDNNNSNDGGPTFVSTNDLVTAVGWILMQQLSGRSDWGMNVVVNIRGRTHDTPNFDAGGGLFGNGITAATARVPPELDQVREEESDELARRRIVAFARECRASLNGCFDHLDENLAASRRGKPTVQTPVGPAFCTTSWHFPLWQIDFEDGTCTESDELLEDDVENGRPFAFHGHPVHPLPPGETFAAVIVPTACRGLDYQLFLPLHHATAAKEYIQHLESLFCQE